MSRSPKALPEVPETFHAESVAEVLQHLGTTERGLSTTQVNERRDVYGPNAFTKQQHGSFWSRLWAQLTSPLAFVLIVAFGVTTFLGEYIDAAVIGIALLIAVILGVLQEGRASRAFDRLARSQVVRATVVRGGIRQEIPAVDLVPGDIIVLQGGAQVPADARLVSVIELSTNEAALTGEWRAVVKSVESVQTGTPLALQQSMVFSGTSVSDGQGTAVVVRTGDQTEVGKLAALVRDTEDPPTPLQAEMITLSRRIMVAVVVLVSALFALGIVMGHELREMLIMAIAIAVASVPEGLPAAVTIVLAISMESLLRRGGLVRNLLAAETLGSTTYVLTDKTGTLTKGVMHLTGCIDTSGTTVPESKLATHAYAPFMFDVAMAATDAYIDRGQERPLVRGDAVERAIVSMGHKLGVRFDGNSLRGRRLDYLPFRSERRYAAGLSIVHGEPLLCVTGAPVTLLEHATALHTTDGHVPLTSSSREALFAAIGDASATGARLVAVGYRPVTYRTLPEDRTGLIDELVFLGIVVFNDPVRDGVADAILGVQRAGARIVLVTGDNPNTALSIARQVGIAGEDDVAVTGGDLAELNDHELAIALREIPVFARVLPDQKMRIATVLQQRGEVVAMTGDGINDAPALRRANIGVALGSGTEVAKESADLVLTKDSFATMYAAIEEGRRVVANIRKIVGYLISTSLTEVVLIGTALLTGAAAPLLPAQILWANVIEEGLMSVAFAFEKGEPNAMKKRPHDIHEEGLVSKAMLRFLIVVVGISSAATLALYFYVRFLGLPLDLIRSVMFISISIDSLFIAFSFRSLVTPVWRLSPFRNPFFIGSFVISLVLLVLVLEVPFFQQVLSYTPLPLELFMLPVIVSAVTMVGIETAKWFFFERRD